MTIERLSFENGHKLKLKGSFREQVEEILMGSSDKIQALPEGNYDITPKCWTEDSTQCSLAVLENGNGIYKVIPRDIDNGMNIGTIQLSKKGLNRRREEEIIFIQRDNSMAIVARPLKEKAINIYEIIFYIPGPSPKKE